jgi:hypothetical protein
MVGYKDSREGRRKEMKTRESESKRRMVQE